LTNLIPCDLIIEAPAKPTPSRAQFLRRFSAFQARPSVGGWIITRKRQADVLEMDTQIHGQIFLCAFLPLR
jgi:hypothetical protein